MKIALPFLVLLCSISFTTHAQDKTTALNIGDEAPPLQISEWIKGNPVKKLEKGRVYVVEFWATWCPPCISSMPRLSRLARKYKRSVTVVGINILEKKKFPKEKGRALVDSMGRQLKYAVAFQDSNFMETSWMDASDEGGVPSSFVVNKEGKIAWIGHPGGLDTVLPKVVSNTWDINTALAKRNFERCIDAADREAREEYSRFSGTGSDFYGEPDSVLFYINKIVARDPDLKYAFSTTFATFAALLKTDMKKAYEYAKAALDPSKPFGPTIEPIVFGIQNYTKFLVDNVPAEIYQVAAEAMEGYMINTPKNLMQLAEFYWRAGDKANARRCLKKARKAMKAAKVYGGGWFS